MLQRTKKNKEKLNKPVRSKDTVRVILVICHFCDITWYI